MSTRYTFTEELFSDNFSISFTEIGKSQAWEYKNSKTEICGEKNQSR